MKKYLYLWRTNQGESLKRPFAQMELNDSSRLETLVDRTLSKSDYTVLMTDKDYQESDFQHLVSITPGQLADLYLDVIGDVYSLAREIFPCVDPVKLYKLTLRAKITFATDDVYDRFGAKVKKDDGTAGKSAATFRGNYSEVLMSLSRCPTRESIDRALKHELGHYWHALAHPREYNNSSDVWLEAMAIFFQQCLNAGGNFSEFSEGTPHFKAANLLSHLRQFTEFSEWDAHTQWHFLAGKTNEKEAIDYIERYRKKHIAVISLAAKLDQKHESTQEVVPEVEENMIIQFKSIA